MANHLTMVLPLPPSVNHIYRHGRNRKPYLSGSYRAWIKQAQIMATLQKIPQEIIPGPVSVMLEVIRGTGWRKDRDLDNLFKATLDFLVRPPERGGWGLLEDDSSKVIQHLEVSLADPSKWIPGEPAAVVVSILPLK